MEGRVDPTVEGQVRVDRKTGVPATHAPERGAAVARL